MKYDDYDIIGSTLWSYPKLNINNSFDFKMIYYKDSINLHL